MMVAVALCLAQVPPVNTLETDDLWPTPNRLNSGSSHIPTATRTPRFD